MFPIVHHFANKKFNKDFSPLLVFGGLFPDLASGMGLERNWAHNMGADFYAWAEKNSPQSAIPLARGILCHGSKPNGLDYYADEYWPGGKKGWCFQQGQNWLEEVKYSTHLPDNLIWWKAHNFIEMCLELLMTEKYPLLNKEILTSLADTSYEKEAVDLFSLYTSVDKKIIRDVFRKVPQIFALEEVSAGELAKKQAQAFALRHQVFDADIVAMSETISAMCQEIEALYPSFLDTALAKVGEMLDQYPSLLKDS
ncbi:MAG: hypothetical protein RR396_02175 [Clostridiales bacterium]